ncbi:MAG: hypothetical protein KDD62_04830, partial [Bdellovibrionales bacterium]|nr:hypothetical protein [Bdellovibrionales bacterium]
DASDAASVRSFAQAHPVKTPEDFERLASQIDAAYSQPPLVSIIRALYPQTYNQKARELLDWGYNSLTRASNILEQYSVTARMMQYAREQFMETTELDQALLWLSLSESAGNSFFALRPEVIGFLAQGSRLNHLDALESALRASFASGGLSKRAFYTLMVEIASLKKSEVEQDEYAQHIQRLSRTIEFAASAYEWEFGHIVSNWSQMEPLANEFIAECLRSSPLAVYSEIFNQLQIDIDSLRNVRHQFFSKQVGSIDLRALNPGLAKGTLVDPALSQRGYQDPATSIYLVPHTIASIPRVAGILTKNEGNPVSHVQLLARNLGIPNIVVTPQLLPELQRALDTELLIASSPAGRVVIDSFGPQYHKLLSEDNRRKESSIDIDLDDLNLKFVQVTSLEELDGDHSSEIVGPKAGKLAELKKLFPGKVSPGIVLPFGVFAKILNVKMASGIPLSDWIKQQYQAIATFQGGAVERQQFVSQVLSTIRTTLLSLEFGPTFIAELKEKMETTFGPDGSYGVFVRSDTNVEDLPNFTGAGLNKTVPNVVGFNDVLAAILKVYASPFEERAFAWRQEFMKQPEHLYVSVLIQKTVPVQMSGVMITSNIFNGDDDFVTIASNEGVGGVVNNQRAEVLLVKRKDNAVELVSEACERTKKIVSRTGGIEKTSTSNQRRILFPNHLQALMNFTTELYDRYDESDMFDSDLFPADVEFGFVNDQLTLFQIRPFVESKSAKSNKFLVELDDEIDDSSRDISMTEPLKKPGIR